MDTVDPKPYGPAETRGEFAAIETAVPGLLVTDLLPKFAALRDVVFKRALAEQGDEQA